jgi:hypothetical protein
MHTGSKDLWTLLQPSLISIINYYTSPIQDTNDGNIYQKLRQECKIIIKIISKLKNVWWNIAYISLILN